MVFIDRDIQKISKKISNALKKYNSEKIDMRSTVEVTEMLLIFLSAKKYSVLTDAL